MRGPPLLCTLSQAWRLKPSLRKLQRSRSLIMGTYYGFLWAITLLNLVRCILQMSRNGTSVAHASLWNAFWLLTRFGAQGGLTGKRGQLRAGPAAGCCSTPAAAELAARRLRGGWGMLRYNHRQGGSSWVG